MSNKKSMKLLSQINSKMVKFSVGFNGEQKKPKKSDVSKDNELVKEKSPTTATKAKKKAKQKNKTKAYGLKSLLRDGNEVIVTTFGKGSEMNYERYIIGSNNAVKEITKEQTFDKTELDSRVVNMTFAKSNNHIRPANPLVEKREDLLGVKKPLEEEFFGKTFDDNIHVQMAYQVLDLKKNLLYHSEEAISSLLHMGNVNESNNEFISKIRPNQRVDRDGGHIGFSQENYQTIQELSDRLAPYAIYFDGAITSRKKASSKEKATAFNFMTFKTLSFLRNGATHGNYSIGKNNEQNILFCLGKYQDQFRDTLDHSKEIFQKDYEDRNKKFVENEKKNLTMIFELYPNEDHQKLYEEFYWFSVWKTEKNMGFNLRKVREDLMSYKPNGKLTVQDRLIQNCDDDDNYERGLVSFNQIRSKIYLLYDFALYRYYASHEEDEVEPFVQELRNSLDDKEKEIIYKKHAEQVYEQNRNVFGQIPNIVKKHKKEKATNIHFNEEFHLPDKALQFQDHTSIVSLLYVLSKMIDSKEGNDLFTTWINKFENIKAFAKLLVERGTDGKEIFSSSSLSDISSLEDISNVLASLNLAKNLMQTKPKMKKKNPKNDFPTTSEILCDAINMFKKDDFVRKVRVANGIDQKTGEEKQKTDIVDDYNDYSALLFDTNASNEGKKVRNFLINSVTNSRRFVYLLRHYSPTKCYKLIHNTELVKYVLGREDMPEEQLERYYKAIIKGKGSPSKKIMVDELTRKLQEVDIDTILGYREMLMRAGKDETEEKNSAIALITMYLTICYLIVKGVENTNAIYFIGFSCLDRDLYFKKEIDLEHPEKVENLYLLLTSDSLDKRKYEVEPLAKILTAYKEARKEYINLRNKNNLTSEERKAIQDYESAKDEYHHHQPKKMKKLIHDYEYLESNYELVTKDEVKDSFKNGFYQYRNMVCHFNVVYDFIDHVDGVKNVKSYFTIYTRALQNMLLESTYKEKQVFGDQATFQDYRKDLAEENYSKNFLHTINMPFAYCLARYKNLSIEDLFNDEYEKQDSTEQEKR